MALPAGAATATITVGVSTDIAGEAGTITGLAVRPECRLVWAATGQPIEVASYRVGYTELPLSLWPA